MSQVKTGAIWQHEKVLPYILTSLKERISEITRVEKIILFGSRGRVKLKEWDKLEGKDWDVLVQASCKIKNAKMLLDEHYHIDLLILNEEQTKIFCEKKIIREIFPNNELQCLI